MWKRSIQPRKQRKYRYNSPYHIKQKFIRAHLSKELKLKYGKRSAGLRTGDRIKVSRGRLKGKTGKIERVDIKNAKIFVTGIDSSKKEGSKVAIPLEPSNLMITDLNLEDKKRKVKFEEKVSKAKSSKGDKNGKESS